MSTDDQPNDPRGDERSRPLTIGALASEVITVLRDRQGTTSAGLRPLVLDHLVRAILSRSGFNAPVLLEQLRSHRLNTDAIIDLYVPHAARQLGQEWIDDGLSFADVTIGALRLQSILSEATERIETDFQMLGGQMRALVVVPQGEQHFLGASVLAAQFRRLGCDVIMSFDECLGMLGARLAAQEVDLIAITCGSDETLESLGKTVQTIRNAPAGDTPVILGGSATVDKKKKLIDRLGVDTVTNNAGEAVAYAAQHRRASARL